MDVLTPVTKVCLPHADGRMVVHEPGLPVLLSILSQAMQDRILDGDPLLGALFEG